MSKDIHTVISEVKEALEKATPGQWMYENGEYGGEVTTDQTVSGFFNLDHWICQLWFKDETPMKNHKANGYLIANAPTWLQQLVTGLEEAHREIAVKDAQVRALKMALENGRVSE
jgi:hypothetical protein